MLVRTHDMIVSILNIVFLVLNCSIEKMNKYIKELSFAVGKCKSSTTTQTLNELRDVLLVSIAFIQISKPKEKAVHVLKVFATSANLLYASSGV